MGSVNLVQFKTFTLKKKKLYGPFLWMGFNGPNATEPLWGDSLLFTTQSLGRPGNHLLYLRRMRLSWSWSHPAFMNPGPLDWESSSLTTAHLDWPISSFTYEEKLFNFSNTKSEQQIHFLHNPFFIHPAMWNATPLFK